MKFSNIERFLRLQKLRPPTRSPSTHIAPGKRALAKRTLAVTTSLSLALASVPFLPTTASADLTTSDGWYESILTGTGSGLTYSGLTGDSLWINSNMVTNFVAEDAWVGGSKQHFNVYFSDGDTVVKDSSFSRCHAYGPHNVDREPVSGSVSLYNVDISEGDWTDRNIKMYSGTYRGSSLRVKIAPGSKVNQISDDHWQILSNGGDWQPQPPTPPPPTPQPPTPTPPSIVVPEVDSSPPVIIVKRTPYSHTQPTDEVTFTISAVDPQGNDDSKPISIDGTQWVASPYTFMLSSNWNALVYARDSKGNVRELTLNVSNIDSENPVITSLSATNSKYTNKSVTIQASASDDQMLSNQPYYWSFKSDDGAGNITETASASSSFTVTKNGTVSLRVRDRIGKYSETKTYIVSNIDTVPPEIIDVKVYPRSSVSSEDGVTVEVMAHDPVSGNNLSSGLPLHPISWNGKYGEPTMKFHKNTILEIKVRDSAGNVSAPKTITIDKIDDSKPKINSIEFDKTGDKVTAPLKVTVNASDSNGSPLTGNNFSYDDGNTWVSKNSFTVNDNGSFSVTIRSNNGATVSQVITISNVDADKPNVALRLDKETRVDPVSNRNKLYNVIKVEASDEGSGIATILTHWNNKTVSDSYYQEDVYSPGIYSVTVEDKAGNTVKETITVTGEMLGKTENNISPDTNIEVDCKPNQDTGLTESGVLPEFSNPSELVYSTSGIYNTRTKKYSDYSSAHYPDAGVLLSVKVNSKDGAYVSGKMTLNGVNYPMYHDSYNSGTDIKYEGIKMIGFIPISGITEDIKNQRLSVQVSEYADVNRSELVRDGSLSLYVSAQISDPVIRYSYNKADQLLTIVPTSTVAGIKSTKYSYDGGSPQEYTAPFVCEKNNKINITVTDNVQNTQTLALTGSDLGLEGGTGSLTTEGLNPNSNVKSYRSSSRTSDSYLINGNQSNTDVIPSKEVFELFE